VSTSRTRPLRVGFTLGVQDSGGVRRFGLEIAAWLLDQPEIELVAIGSRANIDALTDLAGVAPRREVVIPTDRGELEVLWTRHALDRRLGDVDVLHCNKQMVPVRSACPVVLTVHDLLLLDRPDDFVGAKAKLLPPLYRRSILAANHWITACESVAVDLRERFSLPADRITTIPLGASALDTVEAVRPEGVPDSFALVVGDLSPRKNVAYLARLWSEVHEATGLQLIAAGPEGWRSAQSRTALRALEAAGLGRWLGRVTDEELRWLYEHARVVAVPSIAEGYGLAVVEAASFGCPVVASEVPSLRAVAGDGVTTVSLAEPDRWIQALVEAARPDGERPHAPRRTWAQAAQEVLAVYERVVADTTGRDASRRVECTPT